MFTMQTNQRRTRRAITAVGVTLAILGTLSACDATPKVQDPTAPVYYVGDWWAMRLTAGGGAGYPGSFFATPDQSGPGFNISAPPDQIAGNQRSVLLNTKSLHDVRDQEQCATWDSESRAANQQGVMLNVRANGDGTYKGISVMKNVWAGVTWTFNVHYWDGIGGEVFPAKDGSGDLHYSALHSLGGVGVWSAVKGASNPDHSLSAPWSLCARTVGDRVQFKVWTGDDPEPSWDDENKVQTAPERIPADQMQTGFSGVYIGHLRAGESVHFQRAWSPTAEQQPSS